MIPRPSGGMRKDERKGGKGEREKEREGRMKSGKKDEGRHPSVPPCEKLVPSS